MATPPAAPFYQSHGIRIKLVNQGIEFLEKIVTPHGIEGGDPINTTTHANTTYTSQRPRSRKTKTPLELTVVYDKSSLADYFAAIDQSDDVLQIYPDDTTEDAEAGWLRSFTLNAWAEGSNEDQPTADVVIEFYGE